MTRVAGVPSPHRPITRPLSLHRVTPSFQVSILRLSYEPPLRTRRWRWMVWYMSVHSERLER